MTTETLPLNLLKANAELQLRLTRLLQESSHQWLDSVKEASSQGIAETSADCSRRLGAFLRQKLRQTTGGNSPSATPRWRCQLKPNSLLETRGGS